MVIQQIKEDDKALLSKYGLECLDCTHVHRQIFAQDEYLSHAGETVNSIYLVVSGKAKVFISLSGGKQLLLAYFASGGIIGELELMTSRQSHNTTVRAITDFTCIALPLDIYAEELRGNIRFVNYVAEELAKKLTQRVINGAMTTLHPLDVRLCAYITQTATDNFFREPMTEVAEIVGASYRHLLRCFKKLCEKEILRKEASGYRIINQRELDNIASDFYVLD